MSLHIKKNQIRATGADANALLNALINKNEPEVTMSEEEIVKHLNNWPAEYPPGFILEHAASLITSLCTRLNAAEKELAKRAISNYRADQTKQVDEIIRDQISRVKVLESKFRHVHVSNGVNDLCKKCGLDLRDPIHERFG